MYAGDHVLSRVMSEREKSLILGAQRSELTVMFVDIAVIAIPDDAAPLLELQQFVKNYLQTVTDCIASHGGVLDSYVGDMCITWWKDASSACRCAAQVVKRMESGNKQNQSGKSPNIKVRIGIDTGVVLLGNYGSSERIKYTVFGDTVNLASRLCGMANSEFKVPIVITGATKRAMSDAIQTTALDIVNVKGKKEPVELFTL